LHGQPAKLADVAVTKPVAHEPAAERPRP
jgi:hypothetical protein